MSKTITIDPVTRVEGHGKVTLSLDDQGKVSDARFSVKEFRGFERFCEGALAERLPHITSRICGICPVSHFLASTKAVEDCFGVKIPPAAAKLRELLMVGQVFESHILSLAFLSLPDLVLGDAGPAQRNVLGLAAANKEAVQRALELRAAGLEIVNTVGRRNGHPIGARIGGMIQPLTESERQGLVAKLDAAEPSVAYFASLLHSLLEKNAMVINALGDIDSAYMGMGQGKSLAFYDGQVRVGSTDGKPAISFPANQYFDFVEERIENWSYMKFPVLKTGETMRVGPLARVNLSEEMPTPLASKELEWFRARWQRPATKTLCYHEARFVEAVYAFERARELLLDPEIVGREIYAKPQIKAGVGVGIVEAPRGTLVHRYEFDGEGKTTKMDLFVATQHNNMAYNDALKQAATTLITNDTPDANTLNKLEMIVRAFDPCLSCATHTLGEHSFKIELIDGQGRLIREWC